MEDKNLIAAMTLETVENSGVDMNSGSCAECGWSGMLSECERGTESEGWEYPSYSVSYCKQCGAELDDYFWIDDATIERGFGQ